MTMDRFRFHQLESLHWLWLVLAVALLLLYALRAKKKALLRFAEPGLWMHLVPHLSWFRLHARGLLLVLGLMMIVMAVLDPRWGVRYEQVQRRGIDILFVVDVSRSMLAEDVMPNRLDRAKQYINDVVEELGGDRAGLISFAGTAALKCPLTVDYGALRLSLAELGPESAARGGSLLGDALRLAGDCFTGEAKDAKIVFVLSDGEDQASYPVEAAQKLVQATAARIFTVGLGDANEGARIPIQLQRGRTFLQYQGQEVWSRMNPDVLREVAAAGGGVFVPAGIASVDLGEFYLQQIAPLSARDVESSRIAIHTPRYQWFAGIALALLLIESWMSNQRKPNHWPLEQRVESLK